MKIAFDPEFEFYDKVKILKSYHEDCVKFLSVVEDSDLQDVKDKCASGEMLLPKRPTLSSSF